ncbi:MAG: BNR-4 repeat-containing protein [Candidatus Omnitrophica bacterium]|nr:BNR-4 repeat-containing protein [Candidatus Omnitrophota bacterium]
MLFLIVTPSMATEVSASVRRFLLSDIGSERATQGPGNKIVTFGDKTHVVWQDSTAEGYFARIRTLDRKSGEWSETWTLGEGRDNHARPTITVDSKGFLHVIIGGHHTGLQYRKSLEPNDASSWTDPMAFGKSTYPVLICDASDRLHLTGRHDQDWKGLDHYVKPSDGDWEYQGMVVRKQDRHKFYGAYNDALAWGPDHQTLHLSTGFFMGLQGDGSRTLRGLHQAIGYMRSNDSGESWTTADGTPIETPATTETIDLLEEGERDPEAVDQPKPGIDHCGIAVDSNNQPYVVYVRHTPDPMRPYLKTYEEDEGWVERPLGKAIAENWPDWGFLGCRVSMSEEDVLCLLITLVPKEHPEANWNPGVWGRPAFWLRDFPDIHRIVWLESRDGGQTFTAKEIVPHLPDKGTLLPHLEQPTGFNPISGRLPGFLYIEGLSRYTEEGEVIDNKVYYCEFGE